MQDDDVLASLGQVFASVTPESLTQLRQLQELLYELDDEDLADLSDALDAALEDPEAKADLEDEAETAFPEEALYTLNALVKDMLPQTEGYMPRQNFYDGGAASLGRNGDTMLAHITPGEAHLLRSRGGAGTINPQTGLPEFFLKKFFKKVGKVLKRAAPLILGAVLPGVGAVAGFLGKAGATALGTGLGSMIAGAKPKDALKAAALAWGGSALFGGIRSKMGGGTFMEGARKAVSPAAAREAAAAAAAERTGSTPPGSAERAAAAAAEPTSSPSPGSAESLGSDATPKPTLLQRAKTALDPRTGMGGERAMSLPDALTRVQTTPEFANLTPELQAELARDMVQASTPSMLSRWGPLAGTAAALVGATGGFKTKQPAPFPEHEWQNADWLTPGWTMAPSMRYGAMDGGVAYLPPSARRKFQEGGASNAALLEKMYRTELGRDVDPEGRAYWLAELERGFNPDDIRNIIQGTDEYAQRRASQRETLDALYQETLDRNIDESGFDYWAKDINRGFQLGDIRDIIEDTPEYGKVQRIRALENQLEDLLNRPTTPATVRPPVSQPPQTRSPSPITQPEPVQPIVSQPPPPFYPTYTQLPTPQTIYRPNQPSYNVPVASLSGGFKQGYDTMAEQMLNMQKQNSLLQQMMEQGGRLDFQRGGMAYLPPSARRRFFEGGADDEDQGGWTDADLDRDVFGNYDSGMHNRGIDGPGFLDNPSDWAANRSETFAKARDTWREGAAADQRNNTIGGESFSSFAQTGTDSPYIAPAAPPPAPAEPARSDPTRVNGIMAPGVSPLFLPGETNNPVWEALVRQRLDAFQNDRGYGWDDDQVSDEERETLLDQLQQEYAERVRARVGLKQGGKTPDGLDLPFNNHRLPQTPYGPRITGAVLGPQRPTADNIAAALHPNEFVFTTDAVKGAGDGDVNKGIEAMYNLMHRLERRAGGAS